MASRATLKTYFETGDVPNQAQFASLLDSILIEQELPVGTITSPALCIISVGESNSGGYAPNASAFAWELASRPELQMLNTSTLLFQNLDIGTNNNLNHAGLTPATHGWELELANAAKRDEFDRDVYYVQTGQGGSQAIEWSTTGGGNYFNTSFLPRVNAVKAIFGLRPVQYVVWLSLGINDAIASTNSYLFKGRVRSLIAQIKEQLPDVKICVGRIMRTNASYQSIDDRIAELSDDASVRVVPISGLTTVDANHWDYQGMRRFSERLLDATRAMVAIPKRALTFTSIAGTVDGSLVTFSGINQFAHAIETIDFSYDQSIEIDWLQDMYGLIVILDTDINEVNWSGGSDPFLLGVYENGAFYITETNGVAAGNFASAGVSRLRFKKSGNDLLLESTTDMTTWTTRYTRSGVLSGVGNVRIKMKTAIGAAFVRVNAIATKILNPSFGVSASRDPYVVTNYARTQPTPFTGFGIVPFAVDPDVSGRIWASNIAFGSIGHTDDNGATYTARVGNPDPTTGVQSMVFSGSFVYLTISGSTSRHGSVWRSPKPASDGTGLSFTKIFDLNGLANGPGGSVASGGVNSFFRNSCVAVSGANCYVVEYSGLPITGGASVYTSTNVNTATPGNVVFTKTYTWANSKHLHAVKVIGGVPWVTIGDGAQDGLYSDLGLWTATTTAANAWTRRSLYVPLFICPYRLRRVHALANK